MNKTENDSRSNHSKKKIKNDPFIQNLLSRLPQNIANSFSDEQLTHLMIAIGSRSWGDHSVDRRGTLKLPFYKWRFYYVLLLGRNSRELTRREKEWSVTSAAIILTFFFIFSAMIGLFILYLIKSALGIDLFSGFSLGIWSWFKGL